jgi:predicted transcriptional regulator
MTRQKSRRLTDLELEIMHVVWELERGTVRQVHEVLGARRQIAYTTVMTMMNILEEKEYLTRSKQGRAFVYEPVRPKEEVLSSMVDDFVSRVFEGSAKPLVLGLLRERKLSKRELDEIGRLIEEAEDS